jgi:hypothetical protein
MTSLGACGKQVSELVSSGADSLREYWAALVGLMLQPLEIFMLVATLFVFVG